MKIIISGIVTLICIIIAICLFSDKYNEKWIIGKTSDQIIEKYGEFDTYTVIREEDGSFSYAIGSYITKQRHKGFLGTTPETYFSIEFNEEDIAYECYEEMGGRGG